VGDSTIWANLGGLVSGDPVGLEQEDPKKTTVLIKEMKDKKQKNRETPKYHRPLGKKREKKKSTSP